ncbi:MAG: hypothetical protein FWG42_10890 [Clostridiales bacterium]|nr:hypothetical protein [Clostridiales bacterium]
MQSKNSKKTLALALAMIIVLTMVPTAPASAAYTPTISTNGLHFSADGGENIITLTQDETVSDNNGGTVWQNRLIISAPVKLLRRDYNQTLDVSVTNPGDTPLTYYLVANDVRKSETMSSATDVYLNFVNEGSSSTRQCDTSTGSRHASQIYGID